MATGIGASPAATHKMPCSSSPSTTRSCPIGHSSYPGAQPRECGYTARHLNATCRVADRAERARVDDTDTAVIKRRLLVIHRETRLLDFYRERRQLCSVDADRPVDDVTDATFAALADAVA